MKRIIFNPEREQALRAVWHDMTVTLVALEREFSMDGHTLRRVAVALGLGERQNRWTEEFFEAVKVRYLAGESPQVIATSLGVTRNVIVAKLSRKGLLRPRAAAASDRAARDKVMSSRRAKSLKVAAHLSPPKPKPPNNPRGSNGQSKPAMKLAGQGAVFTEAEARQPTVVIPFREEPTPGAKPWLDRTPFECTWIVAGDGADALCCAAPIHGRGWCLGHYKRGISPSSPNKRASEPLQARATARFA